MSNIAGVETGKVKFYNKNKGYGFIVDDNTQTDVFFHVTGMVDEVKEGDAVQYILGNGKKGVVALEVSLTK